MKICSMCRNQLSDNHDMCPHCGSTVLQYVPEQHQINHNPSFYQYPNYDNQQMYQPNQPFVVNPYYHPINNKKKSASDIVGAIFNSIGLYYCLNIIIVVFGDFQKFYDEQIQKVEFVEYKGNAIFWALSVTSVSIICGLIAFIIGLNGKNKGKRGINSYNFVGGIINLVISLIAILYILNFFNHYV